MPMVCMDLMVPLMSINKGRRGAQQPVHIFVIVDPFSHTEPGWKPFLTSEPKQFMKYSYGAFFWNGDRLAQCSRTMVQSLSMCF